MSISRAAAEPTRHCLTRRLRTSRPPPTSCVFGGLLVALACAVGLIVAGKLETDIQTLITKDGSALDQQLQYQKSHTSPGYDSALELIDAVPTGRDRNAFSRDNLLQVRAGLRMAVVVRGVGWVGGSRVDSPATDRRALSRSLTRRSLSLAHDIRRLRRRPRRRPRRARSGGWRWARRGRARRGATQTVVGVHV